MLGGTPWPQDGPQQAARPPRLATHRAEPKSITLSLLAVPAQLIPVTSVPRHLFGDVSNDTSLDTTSKVPIPCVPTRSLQPPQPSLLPSPRYLRRLRSTMRQRLSRAVRSLVRLGWADCPTATPGVLLKRQGRPAGREGLSSVRGGSKDKGCSGASSCLGCGLVQGTAAPCAEIPVYPSHPKPPGSGGTKLQHSDPKRHPSAGITSLAEPGGLCLCLRFPFW